MATVNNASGVYSTLGYNFSDPNGYVKLYSTDTQQHLNSMPAFIEPWQAQDASSGRATNNANYFQNPTKNVITLISTTANLISSIITSNGITQLANVANIANALISTANNFLAHTNRISGVTLYAGDLTVPYYTTAMSYGKQAMYIVNQTDGIINTSPMLGSFTSLLVTPQITANSNVITSRANTIINSISGNTSSLTSNQISQIYSDWSNTNTFLTNQRNADINYFNNLQAFINNYNTTRQFTNLGETQDYLITNFIGTPSLVYNLQNNNNNASYYTNTIVTSNNSSVTNGTVSSGGGAGIVPTGVTAGTYVLPSLNVDIYGRIVAASNVSTINVSTITSNSTTFSGYSLTPSHPHFRASAFYTIPYSPGGSGVIVFNVVHNNVGNCYNSTNGRFTAPVTGVYKFDYHMLTTNDSSDGDVRVWRNGSNIFIASYGGSYSAYKPMDVHFSILLTAGDYIELRNLSGATWHTDSSYHCWASCTFLG
jgi:hypothetical protein